MIDGMMLVWFALTALSVAFVAFDIPKTPESTVLKWAFVILVVFTGPLGAFFYVLGCREPLKGTHAAYIAVKWRQVLGSTMHCAAGDGLGIIAGAALAAFMSLTALEDFALEYALGFSFGWAYFQAFAMRDMYDGNYAKSLKATFLPELFSMNLLMAGMLPTMRWMMANTPGAGDPLRLEFWFTMSMALIVGFAFAYPVNWWLVSQRMKHGMLTVIENDMGHAGGHGGRQAAADVPDHSAHEEGAGPGMAAIIAMGAFSFAALAAGIALALRFEM